MLRQLEQKAALVEQKATQEYQEDLRALQEQARALAIALTARFPGINGEQAILERYLSGLPHSDALYRVLTWSLPELLEAACRGP